MSDQQNNRISFENFGKQLLGQDGQFANSNAWAPVDPQRLILGRPNHPMPDWQANQTRRANFQEMLLNHNANRIAAVNRTLESSINLAARNPLLPKFHPLGSSGTFYPGHSYPKYNLNNVPITEANAPATATATFTNSFQSTPVKMDQLKFAGNQFHTIAESSSQTKDKQENLVSSKEKGIHEYCNELLQQIVDSSPAAISTACGDQKDSDSVIHGEGSGLGIDLNKTPDPKAHIRRKHRPKVIRERKPTRKPNLQKNEVTENPPKKRKYVRRTAKTPQADVITETNDSAVPTRKSSRKSLNFDLEKSGNEGQCRIVGQKEIQINKDHEKDFSSTSDNKAAEMLRGENVRHGTNSVLLIGQQDELPVGNQQSRNTDNITLQMNEKRTNAFSQGRKHSVSFSLVTEKGPTQGNSGCMPQYIQAEELRKFLLQSETSRISQNTKELICQSAYQSLSDIPSNSIEEKGSKRKHSSVDSEIDSAKTPKRTKKTLPRKVDGWSSSQIISKDESQKVRRKGKEVSQSQQSQPNEETPDSSTKIPTVGEIACRLSSLMISKMEGQSALVPYKGDGTIVPYKDAKKQKPKPKVDLDPQTERMWKLLMGKEGSSSIDGTDEEKELWEKERIVFRGRADSFIARMHLVQGDRRFSKWKGSVVDSVVGVFLTQNVSDHLSSSAFLSLAAKFSKKLNISGSNVAGSDTLIKEPDQEPLALEGSPDSSLTEVIGGYTSSTKSTSESEGPNSRKSIMFHQFFQSVNGGASLFEEQNGNGALWSPEIPTLNPCGLLQPEGRSCTESLNNSPLLGSEVFLSTTSTPVSSNDSSSPSPTHKEKKQKLSKQKKVKAGADKNPACDWDALRKEVLANGTKIERGAETMDYLDYEAVRHASVQEISDTIKGRGMNNMLADRIKEFLNRVVNDHGSLDLEWLRHVPPDKVKDYLLSIRGLGLKSVECVRLLTLHHVAFPVDTNVGRIAVRLGWVPLQPLPESLQIHLLDQYPILESVQKYLWPRLCKLDQRTLYELHYQMITFGKVFCTKTNPNCNACPMQAECRHFASAFASARLALPGPEEKGIVAMPVPIAAGRNPSMNVNSLYLPPPGNYFISEASPKRVQWEPIIELPKSPVRDLSAELAISDMEDFGEDPDETSSIESNSDEQKLWECMECCEGDDMSKALVVLTSHFASIPAQKLKYVSRLRTEHQVYELPDSHRLLEKMDKREPDDPSPYLLAIWAPGETANSTKLPERRCGSQDSGNLCNDKTCFSCNSIREADSRIVRGTILIPCRTATKGSFPLNGTYFQVNELFADHASSIEPINIPREWIWNLPRRTVYFGTSVASIFRGLSTKQIQQSFWRGFVCVRGFDQQTRAPRPLVSRLHNVEKRAVKPKTNKKK